MSHGIERLQRAIHVADELRLVVRSMKSLAATNLRQYLAAVASIVQYEQLVEVGFQALLRDGQSSAQPEASHQSIGRIIIGSDQGMCGGFNQRLLDLVMATDDAKISHTSVIGRRAAALLNAKTPVDPARVLRTPTSAAAIVERVTDLLVIIDRWRADHQIDCVVVYHNLTRTATHSRPRRIQLLPLDPRWLRRIAARPWPGKTLPWLPAPPSALFSALVREYLFVQLFRMLAESAASENGGRLRAMQTAERNLDERVETLAARLRTERHAAVSAELMDISSAYEALRGVKHR